MKELRKLRNLAWEMIEKNKEKYKNRERERERNKMCYKKRIVKIKKKLIKPMKQGEDLFRKKIQHSVGCISGLTNNDWKRIV